MKGKLYKEFNIWRVINDEHIVCYKCFEDLSNSKFLVKSSHHYYDSFDEETIRSQERYYIEGIFSLAENLEEQFETLEEAIEKFDLGFADFEK